MPLDRPPTNLPAVILRSAPEVDRVLTADALTFLTELQARFALRLNALMVARGRRQERVDRGELPDYLPETTGIRRGVWEAAPVPPALLDRRVEVIGQADRQTMIAGLNSGARVFVADFEDGAAPSFANMIAGQANLLDHRDGLLACNDPQSRARHRLGPDPALLMMRPRGLHMVEANVLIGGQPVSAALFDFGLAVFHSGRALAATGQGPFFYLTKLESHDEARFWNDAFQFAQERIGLPSGTIKATVLIETLTAAFEMDEIVWQLRDHIAGLACGRWDYTFSYIKTLRNHGAHVLPDRAEVTMDRAFLVAYQARLVKVCHRRGIHAIGGLAALSGADDPAAMAQIGAEKLREAQLGHDGTWVAHPDLVPAVRAIFDAEMPGPNQIRRQRQDFRIEPSMLLKPHRGRITEAGVRGNLSVAIDYLANWLSGRGSIAIDGQIEDAATAEICRAQLWQWLRHGAAVDLTEGGTRRMTADWLGDMVQAEIVAILDRLGATGFHRGRYASAARIIHEAATAPALPDFITLPAYDVLNALD